MKVAVSDLKDKVIAGVKKLGYQNGDAETIADVLMYAQLRGNNQGITKIATGGVPQAFENEQMHLVKENKCSALISGGHSMVSTAWAAEKAVELASKHGVGVVATNRTHTSSGSIGYFARKIAKNGYICLICVGNGDWAAVAPHGSSEAKLGTNPLAYAFPYDGGEVVFDTATAAIAYFGVVEANLKGEPLPSGVAVDSDGNPTTDATDIIGNDGAESVKGAITTFAGHKGYGLSLLVQLLGSAFALAGFPGGYNEDGAGTFVLAIDPGLIAGTEEYMKRSRELIKSIKSARPIPGQSVMLPGERGDELAIQAEKSGEVEISEAIWNELLNFVNAE